MGSSQETQSNFYPRQVLYSNVQHPFLYGNEFHSMATFEDGTRNWRHPAPLHPTFSNIHCLDHIPVEEGDAFRAQSVPHLRTPVCPACGSRLVPASAVSDNHYFQTDFKQPQSGFKRRIVWTAELERAFQTALADLGPRATAKPILEFLAARGFRLTRFQVASHLQKDRKRKQRAATI